MIQSIKFKYLIRVVLVLFFGLFLHLKSNVIAQKIEETPRGTQISDGTSPNMLSSLPFSILELNSTERGFLMPRMTSEERTAIPPNKLTAGLIIYNTSMGCVEFYNATRQVWMNMCGDVEPAIFTIPNDKCDQIGKNIVGDYMQGFLLDSRKNLISVEVNVSSPGTFEIEAIAYDGNVENGYTFTTKGVFPTSGNFLLVLKGSGTPVKGYANSATKDKIKFFLNKKLSSCEAFNHVKPDFEPLAATFDCSKPVRVEATYKIDEPLTSANRLVASVKVTKAGRGKVYGEIPKVGKQTEVIKYESETVDFRVTDVGQVQEVILSPVVGTGKPTTAGELKGKLKLISKGKNEYDPFAPEEILTVNGCDFTINVERGTAKYKFSGNAFFFSLFNSKTYTDPITKRGVPYITPKTNMAKDNNSNKFIVYVALDVEQPGEYKIETNDKNGVSFFNEGIIEKEDLNDGTITIPLYAKGTSGPDMRANSGNKFIAYDLFKGAVGSSPSFSGPTTDVDFVYRPMTMYSIGGPAAESWHPGGFNGPGSNWFAGPRLVRQNKHFSWNGTVRIDGLDIIGIASFEQTGYGVDYRTHISAAGTTFGDNLAIADMVFIGSSGASNLGKNSDQLAKLAVYAQTVGGAVVYGEGNKASMTTFLSNIVGANGITVVDAGTEGPFTIVNSAIAKSASELILGKRNTYFSTNEASNGLYGKYLGSHSAATAISFVGLSNNFVSLASNGSNSFAFVNDKAGIAVIGSSTFMGGYVDNIATAASYPLHASSAGDPLIKKFGTKGDVYNSWFLLNLVHWAIDHAQANKENKPK